MAAFLAVWVAGAEARLVYLQVIKRADMVARAERQHLHTIDAPAKRGDIVDRKGRVLATSVDADTIYAVPSEIGDAEATAAALCRALGDCADKERATLTGRFTHRGSFTYVRRQVSPDQKRRVEQLNLDGVGFMKENKRFYPNKELGAHVLGYVGIDNNGLSGLEAAYDSRIRGKGGRVLVQTDAKRHAFSRFERPPTVGSTIELTIDEYLQHVVERELHAGVVANRAAGGSAIIMNPHTGEILAMANEPTFNPNAYREFGDSARRNRAVQDLYEPGSTFKVVTASAAIEEQVMPIDTMIDTNPGVIHIAGRSRPVTEYQHHNYGVLSFTDVIVRSSNVGAIKIGLRVGTERLSRFVSRFGFGRPVSPDFPGESPGIVWNADKWTESALASVSMGYQVGVTPLQMVAAVSSVANGGELVEPRVIRAVYRDNRRYAVDAEDPAAHDQRRHRGHADDDHGRRRRRRARHGERGEHSGLHDCRQDRHRRQARQRPLLDVGLQRVVCRIHSVEKPGRRDHRRHRLAACGADHRRARVGAGVQAHCGGDAAIPRRAAQRGSRAAGARGPAGRRRTRPRSLRPPRRS